MSGGPVAVGKKYTTRSKGIWEKIRQFLVLVPNRSSGNPLVPLFRVPPPGSQPAAKTYKDPYTVPAGDIKDNQYFNRDYRRNYPQTSSFDQTKISGLLTVGSITKPRVSIGNKGQQELEVFGESKSVSLASTLSSVPADVIKGEILGIEGEPIVAPSLHKFKWKILEEAEHGMFHETYPCRIFAEDRPNVN